MLKKILSITGKPGLVKIVSQGNRMLLVEDVQSGKRFPVGMRDKVVSLGDIAMYTETEDLPLPEIMARLHENTGGEKIDVKALVASDSLREKFAEIVPDFDRERVYPTDIKKLFTWYNILLEAGLTDFREEKEEAEKEEEASAEQPKED